MPETPPDRLTLLLHYAYGGIGIAFGVIAIAIGFWSYMLAGGILNMSGTVIAMIVALAAIILCSAGILLAKYHHVGWNMALSTMGFICGLFSLYLQWGNLQVSGVFRGISLV